MARRQRLSDAIRDARITEQVYARELANQLGVSVRAVESWEAGTVIPNDQHLAKLAELLPALAEHTDLAKTERWERKRKRRRRPRANGAPA